MSFLKHFKKKFIDGREVPDQTKMAIPVGMRTPETLDQKLARLVAHGISQHSVAAGQDSFEEYDDFEDEEHGVPWSGFEIQDDVPPPTRKAAAPAAKTEPTGESGASPAPPEPKAEK